MKDGTKDQDFFLQTLFFLSTLFGLTNPSSGKCKIKITTKVHILWT